MTLLTSPARLFVSILVCSLFLISSCKKENSQTLSEQDEQQANLAATESNAEAEDVFNGVFDDALGVNADVGMGGTGIFSRATASNYGSNPLNGRVDNTSLLPACLNITVVYPTTDHFPVTITFDFGSTGCYANDGHWRKGKIIIDYSNRLLVPGAIGSIKFEDFTIDTIGIDNSTSYTITNTGTADKLQFTVDVNAKLSKPSGNYCEWHSHKVFTRTDGNLTPSPLDDVLKMEGNASGKVKRSDLVVAWKADITDPFIKRFTCRWISKGTIKIGRESLSPSSQWLGILDYGSGNCDNRATLTINGITLEITLR